MDDKQWKRIRRHIEEHANREQKKALRNAAKIRRAARSDGGRRRPRPLDELDDDLESFEKIKRARATPPPAAEQPRRGVISRPDPRRPDRELVLASGVDIAVVVVSVREPPLRTGTIDRFLLIVERAGDVRPLICVNKIDLCDAADRRELDRALATYTAIGVPYVACSASTGAGLGHLRGHLRGAACVFVGHSGVGKTSLMNALDPSARGRTGAVRASDGRGRHTTTRTAISRLEDGTRLIDTPGIRQIGLWHITRAELGAWFPEIAALSQRCRFKDCSHDHEPGCAVRDAAGAGVIAAARYASYHRILADLPPG